MIVLVTMGVFDLSVHLLENLEFGNGLLKKLKENKLQFSISLMHCYFCDLGKKATPMLRKFSI